MKTAPVVIVDLPIYVALQTEDSKWTLKARFATPNLAGAWAMGLNTQKVETRIFDQRKGELFEITEDAVREAAAAIKAAR